MSLLDIEQEEKLIKEIVFALFNCAVMDTDDQIQKGTKSLQSKSGSSLQEMVSLNSLLSSSVIEIAQNIIDLSKTVCEKTVERHQSCWLDPITALLWRYRLEWLYYRNQVMTVV